jgi:hypothetical protein
VGDFERLEDEMKSWVPKEGVSLNRMDATVWAATEVIVGPEVDYGIGTTPDTTSIMSDVMDLPY